MINNGGEPRDLSQLVLSQAGALGATGDLFLPYRLVDAEGAPVRAVAVYFAELAGCARPAASQRSYGMDLLRWFRFLWTIEIGWGQATQVEARDFCRWLQIVGKPVRGHWRYPEGGAPGTAVARSAAGTPNAVTGKPSAGRGYSPATAAHCESVLRAFYDFHLEMGTGPMVNPFPLARGARGGRGHAHRSPLEPFAAERRGRYRPMVVPRAPRCIPDGRFDELFAALGSHRDRALVAFWVSTGARAAELLGVRVGDGVAGEAVPVPDLYGQCERGQVADSAQASQPAHERGVLAVVGHFGDRHVQAVAAGFDRQHCVIVGFKGHLQSAGVEVLPAQPGIVGSGPGLPAGVDDALTQQQLGQPVPGTHEIPAGILPGPDQIAGVLLVHARY